MGEYLHNLRDIYQDIPVPIIKQALFDAGIIDSPASTFRAEDIGEKTRMLKELMESYGDYTSL